MSENKKLDWALHWAGLGLCVFPCNKDTRHPAIKGWPDAATTDPVRICEWWEMWPDANIGAHPGASGHIVIDIDVKKHDGPKNLRGLEDEHGQLLATLRTDTPSGGFHLWYKTDHLHKNSVSKLAQSVDIRGFKGFVIMPGSICEGIEYETNNQDIVIFPSEWEDAVRGLETNSAPKEATEGVEVDSTEIIRRASQYLQGLIINEDVAIEYEGGNDRTYQLFTMLNDYGLTQDAALEVIEPWNEACKPPWSDSELCAIAHNAYNYAQNETGARALADPTGEAFVDIPIEVPANTQRRGRFTPLTIKEMATLPEPTWLIEGLIPNYELTTLFGAYGSYKSFIALDLALSVAAGIAPLEMDIEQKSHPVIYITGEGQLGVGKKRVPTWLAHHGLTGKDIPFRMIPEAPLVSKGDEELIQTFQDIEEACGDELPRLIVIDTHARSMLGLDENTVQDTSKAIKFYEKLLKRYSCAGILVHHTGIDKTRERGSSDLGASSSAMYQAEFDQAANKITLTGKKMKDGECPKPIYLEPLKVDTSVVLTRKKYEASAPTVNSQLYNEVVGVLKDNGAFSVGTALSTSAVAQSMPAVVTEGIENTESARRKLEVALIRASKKELRPLIYPDVSPLQWLLPKS